LEAGNLNKRLDLARPGLKIVSASRGSVLQHSKQLSKQIDDIVHKWKVDVLLRVVINKFLIVVFVFIGHIIIPAVVNNPYFFEHVP
jgi:hypothetical protein